MIGLHTMCQPRLLFLLLVCVSSTTLASPQEVVPAPLPDGQQVDAEQDVLGIRLVTHPACSADIHRLCAEDKSITLNDKTPNIEVISCLLDRQVWSD